MTVFIFLAVRFYNHTQAGANEQDVAEVAYRQRVPNLNRQVQSAPIFATQPGWLNQRQLCIQWPRLITEIILHGLAKKPL
ncbi:hypothetical protein GC207_05245 [bacterium]|nr:hypothetical protein [bacterium]